MKNFVLRALICAASLPTLSHAGAPAPYVEQTTWGSLDGKEIGTYLYNNLSYNVGENRRFTPELLSLIQYKTGGASDFDFQHLYFRLNYDYKNIAKLGDWNVTIRHRITPPTTKGAQKAGNFGQYAIRAALSKDMGPISLTVREAVGVNLVRNKYQIHVPIAEAKGNALAFSNLDFNFDYTIAEDLVFSSYWLLINTFIGGGPYGKPSSWNNQLWQDHGFSYNVKSLGDLGLGLAIFHASDLSPGGAKFKFFSKEATWEVKVSKGF